MAGPQPESMFFTRERAARIVGLSDDVLRRWSLRGLYRPARESGDFYDFRDLVALRVLRVLLERGISARELRRFGLWLHARHDRPWAKLRFGTAGRSVYYVDEIDGGLVGNWPPGQRALREFTEIDFKPVEADVRRSATKINKRAGVGTTERKRGVQGEPVLAGTRIPVRAIREMGDAGMSRRDILREFPTLTERDIDAALSDRAA